MIRSVRRHIALIALFLIAFATAGRAVTPVPTSAGSPGGTLRLSLDECVDRAISQGEDMRLAEANYATARAIYLQARSTALPQLNLNSSYSRQIRSIFQGSGSNNGPSFDPDTTNTNALERIRYIEKNIGSAAMSGLGSLLSGTGFGSKNTYVAALSLRQKLLEGGSIWGSIAAAKHAIVSAQSARTDKKEDVVLKVREAYMAALLADRGVRIAELGIAQAESQLKRVQLRQDAGEASEFALLQAEVQRDNQIPAVLQARSQRQLAYLELARLSNLPSTARFLLTTPMLEDVAVPENPAAVDTTGLVEMALRNPGIVALEQEVEAREHAVTVASSGKWPSLSAVANYSEQAYPNDLFPVRGDFKKDVSAGLQLSWNLFDGLRTKGAIQQSKADRERTALTLQQTRKLIREAVLQGQLDLERAAADLHARSRTVELAKRAYELSSLRFDEGASDLLEVQDARIGYQIAQTNEARARYDYFVALARLERYSGRPVFTSAVPVTQQ